MAAIVSTQTGLWSATSTWVGGAVPINGDSVTIAAGHVVTFDVDQSGFASGVAGMVVTGTLTWAVDGTVTWLQMSGHITGAGSIYVGTEANPIPAPAGATPEVATIRFNGSFYFNAAFANLKFWGEARQPFYGIASKTDNTHIVLAGTGTLDWLRAGDEICFSDSNRKGQLATTTETFTVVSYVAATRTIELGADLTRLVNQNGVVDSVCLLSRCIRLMNQAKVVNIGAIYLHNDGTAVGVRFDSFGRGPLINRSGWTVSFCTGNNNTDGGIVFQGYGHVITSCVGNNNFYGGLAYQGVGHTIISCVANNHSYGGIAREGTGHTINSCTGNNNTLGGIAYIGTGHTITSCTGNNNTLGGIAYIGTGHTITSCTATNGQGGLIYRTGSLKILNSIFPTDGTEFGDYNNPTHVVAKSFVSSEDHNQVTNAFRSWTLGGITDAVTDVKPTGKARSYMLTCASALSWGFYQKTFTLEPGRSLSVVFYIRRNTTTPTDGPDMTLHYATGVDPIMGGTPIQVAVMSGGANAWEVFAFNRVTNSEAFPVDVIARVACKDAAAQVWSVIDWNRPRTITPSIGLLPVGSKGMSL